MELFSDDEVGPATPLPKGGYAARPGTGPSGETCKTCTHLRHVRYHATTFLKCGLTEKQWTHGTGTDINASADACLHWEQTDA